MYGQPAGYSSEEDDYDYFTCDSFSTPTLPAKARPNLERETGETQFYRACIGGKFEELEEALGRGFDVNYRFKDEWSPLLLAASVGAAEVVRLLLEKGAEVNYHKDGYTPLMAAAACPIHTAPYEQSCKVVQMLLELHADPNAINRKRMTALMFAASAGNCLVVNELLKFDNKDDEDNQGWTALFWAVSSNQAEALKLLLEAGFNCDRMDIRGETPLQCAIRHGHEDIIKLLPSITLKSYETITWNNERSFDDFFERGSTSFLSDICVILYGMNSENAMEKVALSNISLFEFLHTSEDNLKELGVAMPYERYRILSGLHRFHRQPFRLKSIPVIKNKEEMSLANVATSIITACRQLVAMSASVKYLMENAENPNFSLYKKEIFGISEKLQKMEIVAKKLNERAIQWDRQNFPPDLITVSSLKRLRKVSWMKRLFKFSIASILICFVINKLKKL